MKEIWTNKRPRLAEVNNTSLNDDENDDDKDQNEANSALKDERQAIVDTDMIGDRKEGSADNENNVDEAPYELNDLLNASINPAAKSATTNKDEEKKTMG